MSQASGLSSGWNGGVSSFAEYALAVALPVELVPEVGFSYDRLRRGRVSERGGLVNQDFGGQGARWRISTRRAVSSAGG
ncbi:hypothetical protein ACU4GR_30045 [Methylobacterium oryzae CBMB20]